MQTLQEFAKQDDRSNASGKLNFDDPIYRETLAFLFACVGMQKPDGKPSGDADKNRNLEVRNAFRSFLTSGPDGLERWNCMRHDSMSEIDFRNWEVKIESPGFLR